MHGKQNIKIWQYVLLEGGTSIQSIFHIALPEDLS